MRRNQLIAIAAVAGAAVATASVTALSLSSFEESVANSAGSTGLVAESVGGEVIEPIRLRSGTFVESIEPVSGVAEIVEEGGSLYLQLSQDFNIPLQEEVQVLLAPEALPPNSYANVPPDSYINLGQLSALEGEQRYLIPPDADINAFLSAVIIDPATTTTLSYAPLAEGDAEIIEPIGAAAPDAIGEVTEPVEAAGTTVIEPIQPTETLELAEVIVPAETAQAVGATTPTETAQATEAAPAATTPTETAQATEAAPAAATPTETAQATEAAPAVPNRAPRAFW